MSKKVTSEPKTISPEEIRAIREGLGLSQAEAGDILGGGPRAFTKYEAGTIKPAQSVINLLRLLESEPSALGALTGQKSVPVADAGQRPFEVTGKHVQALSERMLAVVARKLLSAEARATNIPLSSVHVSGSITTPDAGEDGRIEWTGGVERTDFLPSRLTQLQLKAGRISPSEAGAEVMSTKATVKKMVEEVLTNGGSYVLICAQQYVKKGIAEREGKIRAAIRGAGLAINDEQITFRDAGQVADWINSHPAVATWVLEHTQPGLTGPFRTWGHWQGRAEHDGSPWVEDARLDELRPVVRTSALEPQATLRVVGGSGVGKSRLVLEALGATDEENASGHAISDLVLYADEGQVGPAQVLLAAEVLALGGNRAVLVVDRCAPGTHTELENHVKRKGSGLSVITIDDDVPDEPLPTGMLKVSEAPVAVIEGIINTLAPGLPSEDQRRLVRFSRGFPKIANLVARAWTQELPIARATDESLVDSILVGRNAQGAEKVRKVAELIAAFGRVRIDGADASEMSDILPLGGGLTEADVRKAVGDLARRGIIQRKGRFAVLQPRPIALRLAERQWRHWTPAEWDRVLAGDLPTDLRVRAANQLALLNTTSTSEEVVAHVCRYGGPLASAEGVTTAGNAEVLSSLAEIDAQLVAQLLERALEDVDLALLVGDTRRHLVWALEKVAFSPESFEEGAGLLLRLALAENESYGNNATGQFTNLFPVLLGDTAAGPKERLAFLDDAARSTSPDQRQLVTKALLAGAKTSHFTRAIGPEIHGSRPALEPWRPQTWGEAWDYVRECVRRLTEFAVGEDAAAATAREGLAHEFRALVARGLIDEVETVIGRVREKHEYWPEALDALGDVLTYDKESLDGATVDRVRRLMASLEPKGWEDRVKFMVTEMPWDWPSESKLDFDERGRKQVEAVRELARELLEVPDVLRSLLQPISSGNQRLASVLGEAIADMSDCPLDWLEPLQTALQVTETKQRNFALLAGYLFGLAKKHPAEVAAFKAEAAQSAVFASGLPLICWRLGIEREDIDLVVSALRSGLLSPGELMQWTLGGVLAELPADAVAPFFDVLFDLGPEGLSVGIEVLGMYAHGRSEKLEDLRPQLRTLADAISRWSGSRSSQMDIHHFQKLMGWLLAKGREDPDASAVALTLAKAATVVEEYERSRVLEPLMPQLLSGFPEIVWPLLGNAIVSGRLNAWRMQHLLGDTFAFDNKNNPALLQLPRETLMAWCYANPDSAPAFVASVVPVLGEPEGEQQERHLHPLMKHIIDEFGDREGVLESIYSNMHSFGWTGSRTTYYALYEKPLSSLLEHPIGKVRRWAKRILRNLGEHIDSARTEDEEHEAEWD